MSRKIKGLTPRDTNEFRPRMGGFLGKDEMRMLRSAIKYGRVSNVLYRRGSREKRGILKLSRAMDQRVVVKARVVKGKKKHALNSLRKHLRYLTRSGVGLDGNDPKFYSRDGIFERAEVSRLISKWGNDSHHFRFIISPQNGEQLSLKNYIKDVVSQVEDDLKTKLEWYAVAHHNTDNPHIHLLVRGKDDKGNDLILSRDYISHGFRIASEQVATKILGRRNEIDVRQSQKVQIRHFGLTELDRKIASLALASPDSLCTVPALAECKRERERIFRDRLIGRLAFLKEIGLVKEVSSNSYLLPKDLKESLKNLSVRQLIREKFAQKFPNFGSLENLVLHTGDNKLDDKILGVVRLRDTYDELTDKTFLALSSSEGQTHAFYLSQYSEPKGFQAIEGAIVEVKAARKERRADLVIERVGKENLGIFSLDNFRTYLLNEVSQKRWKIPNELSFEGYVERFRSRLESLSEAGILSQLNESTWIIPQNLLQRVSEFDSKVKRKEYIEITSLSPMPLCEQIKYRGATWLDTIITGQRSFPNPLTSFGREVQRATEMREGFLKENNLEVNNSLIKKLRTLESKNIRAKYEPLLGLQIESLPEGKACGTLVGYELLGEGYRALVKIPQGFVVLPVKPNEERIEIGSAISIQQTKQGLMRSSNSRQIEKKMGRKGR